MTTSLPPFEAAALRPIRAASRMLRVSAAVARLLPQAFRHAPALDILLRLHVAEDAARYLAVDELAGDRKACGVTRRWVAALEHEGLIERRNGVVALSECGHHLVTEILEAAVGACEGDAPT